MQDTSINEPDLWTEDNVSDVGSINDVNHDIEFQNVDFVYPSRKDVSILRNLSLVARAGKTTALVGSSGCGQSRFDNQYILFVFIIIKEKVHVYLFFFDNMNFHQVKSRSTINR